MKNANGNLFSAKKKKKQNKKELIKCRLFFVMSTFGYSNFFYSSTS